MPRIIGQNAGKEEICIKKENSGDLQSFSFKNSAGY